MSEILRVSKPGVNAVTGTAPDNLVFSSDYKTLKYNTKGTAQLSFSSGNAAGTIAHNLGYVPFFAVYTSKLFVGTTNFHMCPGTFSDSGFYTYSEAYADSTNLYLNVFANNSGTVKFVYFIFSNNLGI